MHLNPPRTCLPYTLGSVMLALTTLLLLVWYQPPLCPKAQSPLVEAATASSPAWAIWTRSPLLRQVPRHSALGAYLHALPLTINFFPPSVVFWAVNQGLLLRSEKLSESKLNRALHILRWDHVVFHSLKKCLAGRYYIVNHGNSWQKRRCYKYTHHTEVTWKVGICKGYFTALYKTSFFTSFYYFLLLYTPALQRGNKKWQLLKFR